MIDKYFSWNIDGVQANTVLENAEIEVPIDVNNQNDIFINKEIKRQLENNRINLINIFRLPKSSFYSSIINEIHLTYFNNDGIYQFKYDYSKIFNNILKMLGAPGNIDVKDIDKTKNINNYKKFVLEVKKQLLQLAEVREYDGKRDIITDHIIAQLFDNIIVIMENMLDTEFLINYYYEKQIEEDKYLRKNKKKLEIGEEKHISWKNLMYYTSIKALHNFNQTNDIKYYRYAKNFYKNLGCNPTAERPNGINVDGTYYDYSYNTFNNEFIKIQNYKFPRILIELGIEDKTTITLDRALKNGKGMRGKINLDEPKTNKKVDLGKVEKTLERKIKFYKGLSGKVQGIINGLDTDTDYIGYVFPNNYVIFDKFYDVSKDGTKKEPSYGAGIYVVALDVLDLCDRDRSKIRKYISANHDYKAFKWNHNDTDSYQSKINEVLDYHDVSTLKYKEYILKNETNQNN